MGESGHVFNAVLVPDVRVELDRGDGRLPYMEYCRFTFCGGPVPASRGRHLRKFASANFVDLRTGRAATSLNRTPVRVVRCDLRIYYGRARLPGGRGHPVIRAEKKK